MMGSWFMDPLSSNPPHSLSSDLKNKIQRGVMEESERCRKKERRKAEKKHKCMQCEAAFAFPNKLRLHINSHHSLSHVCDRCDARFDRFVQLRTHMAFAHKTKHQCHLCAYSSSVKAELKKHVVANHENGVTCTIDGCNITIAYNRPKRHIREAHCRNPNVAGRAIDDGQSEERRNLSCGGTPTDECGSVAGSCEDPLSSNIGSAVDEVTNGCCLERDDISETALTPQLPDDCVVDVNGKESTSPGCSASSSPLVASCAATCSRTSDNASEKSFDLEKGDFSEEDCTVQPGSNEIETKDYIADDGIRRGEFVCTICRKRFRRLRDQKRHHRRVHERSYKRTSRQKKFRCTEPGCERMFSIPAKLREHQALHSGEVVVSCDNCEKRFKSRAFYAVHLRRYHQLSIRHVNCSPRFVSLLKAEAAEPRLFLDYSSTPNKILDGSGCSSSSVSISNELSAADSNSGPVLNDSITADSILDGSGCSSSSVSISNDLVAADFNSGPVLNDSITSESSANGSMRPVSNLFPAKYDMSPSSDSALNERLSDAAS